jgi:hypothetical protein
MELLFELRPAPYSQNATGYFYPLEPLKHALMVYCEQPLNKRKVYYGFNGSPAAPSEEHTSELQSH